MKLILHIGMSKSGSTAIQHGLETLRAPLAQAGYLYPQGQVTAHNHSFLIAGVNPLERLPRHYRNPYLGRPKHLHRTFQGWITTIRTEIAQTRPDTLLLSGETLFKLTEPDQFKRLSKVLRSLADTVEIVAYVRRPSDFYISSAQQQLKASHRIKPIGPVEYRRPLEGFAAIADRLHVFAYDRSGFPDGDVLRHFMENFAPAAVPEGDLPRLAANVSLSAESLALLAAYRRRYHADRAGQFARDSNRVLAALAAADEALPGKTRLKLKPEIARIIDEGSSDLLWLRATYGITFAGVDYAAIAPMAPQARPRRVGQICQIDRGRKETTALFVMHHLAALSAAPGDAAPAASSSPPANSLTRILRK